MQIFRAESAGYAYYLENWNSDSCIALIDLLINHLERRKARNDLFDAHGP